MNLGEGGITGGPSGTTEVSSVALKKADDRDAREYMATEAPKELRREKGVHQIHYRASADIFFIFCFMGGPNK